MHMLTATPTHKEFFVLCPFLEWYPLHDLTAEVIVTILNITSHTFFLFLSPEGRKVYIDGVILISAEEMD